MSKERYYQYVGLTDMHDLLARTSLRTRVQSPSDVQQWIEDHQPERDYNNAVVVTFIISAEGDLWISERRSEHVQCAGGKRVLSAGEMSFAVEDDDIEVIEVTNQSTGYCPEPESWWAVEQALDQSGMSHPGHFTMSFTFRRCEVCGSRNIVKDDWFKCGVCQSSLPETWNFNAGTTAGTTDHDDESVS